MKLTKKELEMMRELAFFHNVFDQKVDSKLEKVLSSIQEKKKDLALEYYQYLTTNAGKKTYVVDFIANGAGHLTFHDCTAEEAVEKALYKLQNGAFGNDERLENIKIQKVRPETISYNQLDDFLQWKSQLTPLS